MSVRLELDRCARNEIGQQLVAPRASAHPASPVCSKKGSAKLRLLVPRSMEVDDVCAIRVFTKTEGSLCREMPIFFLVFESLLC